ncbi:MAG: radical SAM protein [Gemmataceae bacterium]
MACSVAIVVPLGIDKIRLTGGEPLLRKNLDRLVRMLVAIPGIKDVGLTTNGITLAEHAQSLWDAGLRRINISLDTLEEERFRSIARRPGVDRVVAGILAAKQAGFDPVKVNGVAIRGTTEDDIVPLCRFAREHGVEMRFIEYMPIGADDWERSKVLYAHEILEKIEAEVGPLVPAADYDPRNPAMDFDYADGGGRVGIIASVSRPFCRSCNRIRLTAEGKLACLFALEEIDMFAATAIRKRSAPPCERAWPRSGKATRSTAHASSNPRTMHAIGG